MDETPGAKIPVAVIGLGAFGLRMAEALLRCDAAQLVALGDRDAGRARQAGERFSLPHFTDNRQLLLTAKPHAVFLAAPPMGAAELLTFCAEKGIHVWKETPLGRNLEEAAAFVRRFEAAGLKLAVGTQRRFAESYRRAHEHARRFDEILLARSHYFFHWGPDLRWRADKHSAGGGALLEVGYHCIDLLTWTLGLPEQAYGATVTRRPLADEQAADQPLHDTDDSASAILRYPNGCLATLVASRLSGPVSEELALHGRAGSVLADSETCTLRSPDGDVLDHFAQAPSSNDVFRKQAESFCLAVRDNTAVWECSAAENLLNLAVVEAIYLSHATGQPENPIRQLHTHGLGFDDCLRHRPPEPEE
jgi:predicted dehydrogenase